MPRVMTVDDSRSVRTMLSKQLLGQGFEVDEAEDGKQALDKLSVQPVDLILLDVTMPVMDGPTMLSALRAAGNLTPVVMLTSEARSSVIADAMKHGIDGYILKPFEPSEMLGKVRKALKLGVPAANQDDDEKTLPGAPSAEAPKESSDVLVVDDMDNVLKRVRALMPESVAVTGVLSAKEALAVCREKSFKVVLIDYELKGLNGQLLASQIRMLQPSAALAAMAVRTAESPRIVEQAKSQGYSEVLLKPFSPEAFEDFVLQYFDRQDIIKCEGNVLTLAAYIGKPERVERYFARVSSLIGKQLEAVAAACFEGVVIDLSRAPAAPERLPKVLATICGTARGMGLKICLVGSPDVQKVMKMFEETKSVPCFLDLERAKAEVG